MQLSFLGKSYETSAPAMDAMVGDRPFKAIATGETATFMGRPYARKQFTVAQRQQPADLIYRGVRYVR